MTIPGDAGPPVVGHSLAFLRDPLAWQRSRYAAYGPVSRAHLFGRPAVILLGPEANAAVLRDREAAFSQRGWHHFLGPFFTRGLMLLDFDEHRHHRRIMQHAFRRPRLRGYAEQMDPVIAGGTARWRPSPAFRVYPALKRLTLDVAARAFVGRALDGDAERINRAFVDTVRAATAVVRAPLPGSRWRRGLRGRAALEASVRSLLPAARSGDDDHLLAALCSARSPEGATFSDDDVVNHIIFLLMAAHDTTTTTLTTMIYLLARHPAWQEAARREAFARATQDPLADVAVIDQVMDESMRLVAPVPSLPRITVRDTEVLGHVIPRETLIGIHPTMTHRMAGHWAAPDGFDPSRFAGDRGAAVHRDPAYIPFGGGAHRCIGMHFGRIEVRAVMHHLLRRFRWSVPPSYTMPLDMTALPRPADGLPVRLARLA